MTFHLYSSGQAGLASVVKSNQSLYSGNSILPMFYTRY